MNRYLRQPSKQAIDGLWPEAALFEEPKCNVGIAVGLGVAALGAGVYGAISSSDAQKQAADTAAQSQQNANQMNYQMFQQSRGQGGSAVLPLYLQGSRGGLFEPQLGGDITRAYADSSVPLSSFQRAAAPFGAAERGAGALTGDIFSGAVTNRLLSTGAPVRAARTGFARSSAMDALNKTLDSIDATQASRGMVGDSYGNRLLRFNAGMQAGNTIGAANIQNLQDVADTQNYGGLTLPLQNITLPYSQAQQAAGMEFLPSQAWLSSIGQRMQPLNFMHIGTTPPFQYQPLPTPGPGAYSGTANALMDASGMLGQGSGAATNYYLNRQLMNSQQQNALAQIRAWQGGPGSYSGWGTGAPLAMSGAAGGGALPGGGMGPF